MPHVDKAKNETADLLQHPASTVFLHRLLLKYHVNFNLPHHAIID